MRFWLFGDYFYHRGMSVKSEALSGEDQTLGSAEYEDTICLTRSLSSF